MDLSGLLAEEELTALADADIPRVDLVQSAASGIPRFLLAKQAEDASGLLDPGFVRDLIAKAEPEQPGRERVTMPSGVTLSGSPADIAAFIHKAAQRAAAEVPEEAAVAVETVAKDMPGLDDSAGGMDPTMPLAAPDGDYAGSPAEPGSPMWEAIDAATACKWTSMLARARAAVSMLAEREMLEAASGDEGDACNAMDLEDACCAIDCAIGILAPFAVAEQSEADSGDMDAMAMVGKSAADLEAVTAVAKAMGSADLAGPLSVVETYGAIIRKAGRVLSSVNEQRIRTASASLQEVLSSLPAPVTDDGQPVAKMTPAEEADMPETMPSEDVTAASGQQPAMGAKEEPPAAQEAVVVKAGIVLQVGLFDHARRLVGLADPAAIHTDLTAVPVTKADGDKAPMMVVYNQAGDLVGIVSPDDITPVANSTADPDDAPAPAADPDGDGTAAAMPADAATDMTPAPAGETGTPSGGVDDVAKGGAGQGTLLSATNHLLSQDALESIIAKAVTAALGAVSPAQDVAKSADVAGLVAKVGQLEADLEVVKEQPAMPKVFTNGAVPPAHQLRGQDQGAAAQVDVAKAMERRREFLAADPAEQNRIANGMQQEAIDALAAIHGR